MSPNEVHHVAGNALVSEESTIVESPPTVASEEGIIVPEQAGPPVFSLPEEDAPSVATPDVPLEQKDQPASTVT